jgi:hypothetical protein
LDLFFLILVIGFLFYDILIIISSLVDKFYNLYTDTTTAQVDIGNETVQKITGGVNNIRSDALDDFLIKLKNVIDILRPILEPIQVDYSNVVLAEQIYGISIILFILSVLIIVLLLAFMLNILILVYSHKLLNFY